MTQVKLHDLKPVEMSGRDTAARYEAQYRGAAYESLAILSGAIDRVYCDFQDDFVTRRLEGGEVRYCFYQVKTNKKPNFQWGRLDVFGLKKQKKQDPARYADSFAGKLLFHTVRFGDSCSGVVFLSNVHLNDELELAQKDLAASKFDNPLLSQVLELFNAAYAPKGPFEVESIKGKLRKLTFRCGLSHLNPAAADFHALARDAIYQFSEVDLRHVESQQIVSDLVNMVRKKSLTIPVGTLDEPQLDQLAGIGLTDLLEVLSLSPSAFEILRAGGDGSALRTVSILQRKLRDAKAGPEMIEFCSRWKVEWDNWFRDKRHFLGDLDIAFLLERLNATKNDLVAGNIPFQGAQARVESLMVDLKLRGHMAATISPELLFGGVLAALVRSEAI